MGLQKVKGLVQGKYAGKQLSQDQNRAIRTDFSDPHYPTYCSVSSGKELPSRNYEILYFNSLCFHAIEEPQEKSLKLSFPSAKTLHHAVSMYTLLSIYGSFEIQKASR